MIILLTYLESYMKANYLSKNEQKIIENIFNVRSTTQIQCKNNYFHCGSIFIYFYEFISKSIRVLMFRPYGAVKDDGRNKEAFTVSGGFCSTFITRLFLAIFSYRYFIVSLIYFDIFSLYYYCNNSLCGSRGSSSTSPCSRRFI